MSWRWLGDFPLPPRTQPLEVGSLGFLCEKKASKILKNNVFVHRCPTLRD